MFGWFKPTCPVEPAERTWAGGRMRWLQSEFGPGPARGPVVLPTPEFFPEPYGGSEEDGRVLVGRVCRYMGVAPGGLEVVFYTERRPFPMEGFQSHHGAAGLYEQSAWGARIQIERAALRDPLTLVATTAHELAHLLLLGGNRLTGDEPDHEQVTDLLTVYLGLGVFTANSRVRSQASHDGLTESWEIRRLGYLSQQLVGYALALYARLREEDAPAWASHLCPDVRSYFKQAQRWLKKGGTSLEEAKPASPVLLSDDELPPGFGAG